VNQRLDEQFALFDQHRGGYEVFVGTGRLDTDNYYCTVQ